MNILESVASKENFGVWALFSAIIIMLFYVMAVMVIRIYHLRFNKRWESLSVEEAANTLVFQPEIMIQRVFEVIVADTCILGACFIYNIITAKFSFLSDYNGFILLGLIIVAIICNNVIDKRLRQNLVDKEVGTGLGENNKNDKVIANLRLLSSIAVLIMLVGFSIYCKTDAFFQLIICVIGLVLGRFIYFDTTWQGFKETIGDIGKLLGYAFCALVLTLIILGLGIFYNVIDTNNILMSVFAGHIFVLIMINVTKGIVEDLL